MVVLLVVIFVLTLLAILTAFLLGFRLGGERWQSELTRVRLEAAHAERQLHDLTREAFVAMAERIERRRE